MVQCEGQPLQGHAAVMGRESSAEEMAPISHNRQVDASTLQEVQHPIGMQSGLTRGIEGQQCWVCCPHSGPCQPSSRW